VVGELDSGGDQVWGARFGPHGALVRTDSAPTAWLYEPAQSAGGAADASVQDSGIEPMALEDQGGGVVRAAFSPDGTLVATAVVTGDAMVWDTRDGHLVHRVHGHFRGVDGVAFSPDGSLLATAGLDGLIKLWNTSDWSLRRTLQGHRSSVTYVAFGPSGNLLVSSSSDQTVRIWRHYDMPFEELVADARTWLADYQNLPPALRDELLDASAEIDNGESALAAGSADPEETDR
jgi:WD40 repeat protein